MKNKSDRNKSDCCRYISHFHTLFALLNYFYCVQIFSSYLRHRPHLKVFITKIFFFFFSSTPSCIWSNIGMEYNTQRTSKRAIWLLWLFVILFTEPYFFLDFMRSFYTLLLSFIIIILHIFTLLKRFAPLHLNDIYFQYIIFLNFLFLESNTHKISYYSACCSPNIVMLCLKIKSSM